MSPFTLLNHPYSGNGIDRNFSRILNYLDEFDRHFSHHHRFMNCFIPRFDLEEDASFYYLYGEVPGAKVEDINIEAHDNHTLVVSGTTHRPSPTQPNIQSPGHEFVIVDAPTFRNGEYVENDGAFAGHAAVSSPNYQDYRDPNPAQPRPANSINADVSDAAHPGQNGDHHYPPPPPQVPYPTKDYSDSNPASLRPESQSNFDASKASVPSHPTQEKSTSNSEGSGQAQHRVILSERLVGDFHRTFAFPTPIAEEGTRASVENGVLCLVVPKREVQRKVGRRIPILGNWGQGSSGGKYEVR